MAKHLQIVAAILLVTLSSSVFCQQCPSGWYGYSITGKCYKFNVASKLTWQDARDYCQTHQGDLLKVDTANELKWVLGQVQRNYRQHAHYNGQIWTGLNNREYLTTWEWADGSAAGNFIPWNPNEPNNYHGKEGCAEIVANGKFNDDVCSNKYPFICYRNRGIPLLCDADHGWQAFNGACYKVYTAKKNWNQANHQCSHNGGSMVSINSTQSELVIHGLAADIHQPIWIGLSTQKLGNQPLQWIWSADKTTLQTSYWHGTPHIDRAHQNGTCATMSNTLPYMTAWNPSVCTVPRAYACQKPQGVCLPGWIGHRQNCWQFNLNYRLNFNAASTYCTRQGGKLASAKVGSDQMFIQGYLKLIKDSGISNFWIGISDNNKDNGPFLWRDNSRVNPWRPSSYHPRNTPHKQDCGYIATNDLSGNWRLTSNCALAKAFLCKIPMGKPVRSVRTPRPTYGCPSGWRMNSQRCFKVVDQGLDYNHARNNCRKAQGGDLAKISTSGMQGFINHLLKRDINYWIGLNDRVQNGLYVWNDETVATTYTNWAPHEPNNYGAGENCVINKNGKWNDFACNRRTQSICSMSANQGFVVSLPPSTPAMDWTVKCGPGWDSNPTSDYCYYYGDTPLSWLDALNGCRDMHGDLLSIESIEEQNYIAGKMSAMGSIAVWTGANDRASEGGWSWSSKRPFAFFNWAPNQPSSGGAARGQDCVAMFTQSAKWDDMSCTTRNGYICEKKGNVPTTPAPKTTTPHLPAGMVLGCRPGWLPFRESCYRVVRRSVNWSDAQKICGQMASKLSSIRDKPEQDFITGNLVHVKNSWDGYWIGLNDKQIDNRFQWTDGSTVTYTAWNTNEPNNYMNRNEDCVLMVHTNGKWNDELCTESRSGFICKAAKAAVSATQSPYQQGCPLYSEGHGSYCYRFVQGQPLGWSASNTRCKRLFNGTLAVINDRFLQAFLSSSLVYRRGYFWMGLSDTNTTGVLNWVDGSSIRYTNWYNTHTGNERSTCVAIRSLAPSGLWENKNCSTKSYSLCQFPRSGDYVPPTTPTPYPNVPCSTGWTPYNAFCYRAYPDDSTKATWMDASAFCQSLGGNLPSFHNNQNDSIMDTLLLSQYRGKNFWIGFNDRNKEAGHEWSDGSAVDFTHWNYNEPNDYHGYEDCVVYNVGSHWNDQNCYLSSPFVCAVPRGVTVAAPTQLPTGAPSAMCPNSNWLLYGGNCYWLSQTTGDNSSVTWYDANSYCQGMQSNLASIHNQTQHGFLLSLVTKTNMSSYWIGLNMLDGDSYKWSDHTPVDFSFWADGQPDNYFGSERCVHMMSYGFWNDDHCSNPKNFICEKPVNGQAQIFTPAPYPSGGCKTGFTRVPGGRNKCFYIAGVQNIHDRRNWTEAYKYCRSFGSGYDIAAVEDLYEQEFLLTMTQGMKQSLWIGLTDNRGNGRFIWQNNVPTIYTNWDSGEPTSSRQHGQQASAQNCVLMRLNTNHEGRWADAYCALKLGFVCQTKQVPSIPIIAPPNPCRQGYQSYLFGCYAIKQTANTWDDAQADCRNDGANLASLTSVQEAAFIQTMVKSKFQYWVGLSDKQMKGFYSWVDGWPLMYSNWGWKEPTYTQNSSTGCILVNMNGKWNDTDCSRKLKYACKISAATPPPTPPPGIGTCANSKWVRHGQFCYYVYVTNGRSWPEANYLCQSNGQQLVSIHSEDELSFVVGLVRQAKTPNPKYRPNAWVGLSQGGHGAYKWSDGSVINFMKWRVGEPSKLGTHGQVEQCVEIDRDNATFNDIDCFTNRGFVCKSPVVTSTPAIVGNPSQGPVGPIIGGPTGSVIGRPTGPGGIGLPTYKQNTAGGGVLPGQGASNLPFVTYPNGNYVTDGYGNKVTAARLQQNQQVSTSTLGLSNGGIAGVVIGCLIVLVLVAMLLVYLKRNGQIKAPLIGKDDSLGFDNALYNRNSDAVKLDSDA